MKFAFHSLFGQNMQRRSAVINIKQGSDAAEKVPNGRKVESNENDTEVKTGERNISESLEEAAVDWHEKTQRLKSTKEAAKLKRAKTISARNRSHVSKSTEGSRVENTTRCSSRNSCSTGSREGPTAFLDAELTKLVAAELENATTEKTMIVDKEEETEGAVTMNSSDALSMVSEPSFSKPNHAMTNDEQLLSSTSTAGCLEEEEEQKQYDEEQQGLDEEHDKKRRKLNLFFEPGEMHNTIHASLRTSYNQLSQSLTINIPVMDADDDHDTEEERVRLPCRSNNSPDSSVTTQVPHACSPLTVVVAAGGESFAEGPTTTMNNPPRIINTTGESTNVNISNEGSDEYKNDSAVSTDDARNVDQDQHENQVDSNINSEDQDQCTVNSSNYIESSEQSRGYIAMQSPLDATQLRQLSAGHVPDPQNNDPSADSKVDNDNKKKGKKVNSANKKKESLKNNRDEDDGMFDDTSNVKNDTTKPKKSKKTATNETTNKKPAKKTKVVNNRDHMEGNILDNEQHQDSDNNSATNQNAEDGPWLDIHAKIKLFVCMAPRNTSNSDVMIRHANADFFANFGFSESDSFPMPLKHLFGHGTNRRVLHQLHLALLTGKQAYEFINLYRADKRPLACHVMLVSITGNRGKETTANHTIINNQPMADTAASSSGYYNSYRSNYGSHRNNTSNNNVTNANTLRAQSQEKYAILTIRSASVIGNAKSYGIGFFGPGRMTSLQQNIHSHNHSDKDTTNTTHDDSNNTSEDGGRKESSSSSQSVHHTANSNASDSSDSDDQMDTNNKGSKKRIIPVYQNNTITHSNNNHRSNNNQGNSSSNSNNYNINKNSSSNSHSMSYQNHQQPQQAQFVGMDQAPHCNINNLYANTNNHNYNDHYNTNYYATTNNVTNQGSNNQQTLHNHHHYTTTNNSNINNNNNTNSMSNIQQQLYQQHVPPSGHHNSGTHHHSYTMMHPVQGFVAPHDHTASHYEHYHPYIRNNSIYNDNINNNNNSNNDNSNSNNNNSNKRPQNSNYVYKRHPQKGWGTIHNNTTKAYVVPPHNHSNNDNNNNSSNQRSSANDTHHHHNDSTTSTNGAHENNNTSALTRDVQQLGEGDSDSGDEL